MTAVAAALCIAEDVVFKDGMDQLGWDGGGMRVESGGCNVDYDLRVIKI
jgi:hypothetical protein